MNRSTLISAINMGLKRAAARGGNSAESVADAIEVAIELESSMNPPATRKISQQEDNQDLPPNPVAIQTVAERDYLDPTRARPAEDPDMAPSPPRPSLVIPASEAELNQEIRDRRGESGLKVRKLFLGTKLHVGLEDLMAWVARSFPATIRITPINVDHEIELVRNVAMFPMTGDNLKNEKESTVKVTYKHPGLGSDMEVGLPIRVGDAQEEFPPVKPMLDRLIANARELYKARPKYVESRAPTGPNLYEQHSMSKRVGTPGKGPAPIMFMDADDTSLSRS